MRPLLLIAAALAACATTRPADLPPALQDASKHPRFPAAAFLTAIGYGTDRGAAELDAKKRVNEALASRIESDCRSEQSAGPKGESDSSECKVRVQAAFAQAHLIRIDETLDQDISGEWRAFAYLDRKETNTALAQEQGARIEELETVYKNGAGMTPAALRADCEAQRLTIEVKRGLAVRRSLVGRTADEARIEALELAAAHRRAERSGAALVSLVGGDETGQRLVRAIRGMLEATQLKVREGEPDGPCALGLTLKISTDSRSRDSSLVGKICSVALSVAATYCNEAREAFTLKPEAVSAANSSDAAIACRAAERKVDVARLATEATARIQGALGLSCAGN